MKLTVASLNAWNSGRLIENGHQIIAKLIGDNNIDIICFQEINFNYIKNIKSLLNNWHFSHQGGPGGYAILSRYPICHKYNTHGQYGQVVDINVNNNIITIINCHLHNHCFKNSIPSEYKILNYYNNNVVEAYDFLNNNVLPLFEQLVFKYVNRTTPIIIAGDHNMTKYISFEYMSPINSYLKNNQFIDSFDLLQVNTFAYLRSQVTFGTQFNKSWNDFCNKYQKQRRIDYIHFKNIHANEFNTIDTVENNLWPSDHKLILTVFDL